MRQSRPLTEQAQAFIADEIPAGGLAIDATAGNGLDLEFLCRLVGSDGFVWGFDIQADALRRSLARLDDTSLASRATLVEAGHEEMERNIPREHHGRISRIMFNLGYLPGGDHAVTTRTATTLQALQAAIRLLSPEGRMTVVAYPGHPGGEDETVAVLDWSRALSPAHFDVTRRGSDPEGPGTPVLLLVSGRGSSTG